MDHKSQIEMLKEKGQSLAAYNDPELAHFCEDAIDAIETLLIERDAAVESLHGECRVCFNNSGWHNVGPCRLCVHEPAPLPEVPKSERTDNWEWQGPKSRKVEK